MNSTTRLVLCSLSLVLVLFPLTAAQPGQPPTLKADEPAYFLMSLSLAEDGDLVADSDDIRRAFDHYPYLPVANLILMSPDRWETTYFGKPYIYSFFATPFAALFGSNGFKSFNMLMLVAMVWMGTSYLRKYNSDGVAALYSTLFFVLSPAFAYVFWIHPEIFNMFSIAACLYLAFHQPETSETPNRLSLPRRLWGTVTGASARPWWSGAALALATYNKPMLGLMGVPALFYVFRKRGWKSATGWIAGAALAMTLIAGISVAYTGKPSAYLGVARGGINILKPEDYETSIRNVRLATAAHRDEKAPNSWHWMFRVPDVKANKFLTDVRYFLFGRHTGLVPYMPFAVLSVLFFLFQGRGSRARWLTLGSLALVALVFLLWIPFNWHGGGGFVGNRYYVNVYPAFLFLVTAIRPLSLSLVGTGFATLLLGSILFNPWGLPVPHPTLQSHTRGGLFRYFPLELSLHSRISGYSVFGSNEVGIIGRKDVFKQVDELEGVFWTRGGATAEVWVFANDPLGKLYFDVQSWAPTNRIILKLGRSKEVLDFVDMERNSEHVRTVGLTPSRPVVVTSANGKKKHYYYKLLVTSDTGIHEGGNMVLAKVDPLFYVGASLTYLGAEEPGPRDQDFRVSWQKCEIPKRLATGSRSRIDIRATNVGKRTWQALGETPVRLTYHWLDGDGNPVRMPDQPRPKLRRNVPPGGVVLKTLTVYAPEKPGRHTLVFEGARRHLGWFPRHEGGSCASDVVVYRDPGGKSATQ